MVVASPVGVAFKTSNNYAGGSSVSSEKSSQQRSHIVRTLAIKNPNFTERGFGGLGAPVQGQKSVVEARLIAQQTSLF